MSHETIWIAEYKGSKVVVHAIAKQHAQQIAAVELGVPKSRQRLIRVIKEENA